MSSTAGPRHIGADAGLSMQRRRTWRSVGSQRGYLAFRTAGAGCDSQACPVWHEAPRSAKSPLRRCTHGAHLVSRLLFCSDVAGVVLVSLHPRAPPPALHTSGGDAIRPVPLSVSAALHPQEITPDYVNSLTSPTDTFLRPSELRSAERRGGGQRAACADAPADSHLQTPPGTRADIVKPREEVWDATMSQSPLEIRRCFLISGDLLSGGLWDVDQEGRSNICPEVRATSLDLDCLLLAPIFLPWADVGGLERVCPGFGASIGARKMESRSSPSPWLAAQHASLPTSPA